MNLNLLKCHEKGIVVSALDIIENFTNNCKFDFVALGTFALNNNQLIALVGI